MAPIDTALQLALNSFVNGNTGITYGLITINTCDLLLIIERMDTVANLYCCHYNIVFQFLIKVRKDKREFQEYRQHNFGCNKRKGNGCNHCKFKL